jgi:hypothetical protein
MKPTLVIGRREFTRESILAALSGVVITVTGCGGGGGGGGNPTSPTRVSGQGTVLSNHGHAAVVTDAQITAGNAVQIDITGSANHPHTVLLSAQAIQAIAGGRPVAATSSIDSSPTDGSHMHTVTFNGEVGEPTYY